MSLSALRRAPVTSPSGRSSLSLMSSPIASSFFLPVHRKVWLPRTTPHLKCQVRERLRQRHLSRAAEIVAHDRQVALALRVAHDPARRIAPDPIGGALLLHVDL